MKTAYFYSLPGGSHNKPACAGILIDGKTTIYDLFRPNQGTPYRVCKENVSNIRSFLLKLSERNVRIVCSDFKRVIKDYSLPIDNRRYSAYDLHLYKQLANIKSVGNQAKDHEIIRRVLDRMGRSEVLPYQNIIANAAVVYSSIEDRGITVNDLPQYPNWSLDTYSGRSKCTGFNIQGHSTVDLVSVPEMTNVALLHFDWIAADIRVAALLSNDEKLAASFMASDPYTHMCDMINASGSGELISRDECKLALLKAINSMDIGGIVLSKIYPQLGKWITSLKDKMHSENGEVETMLGRKFILSQSKNALAVLNGVMQGSVVHAMQLILRRIWERLGQYILAEIHDSLVMCVPRDPSIIKSVISIVSDIMTHPFRDVISHDPFFPIKVSIGKKWKDWKLYDTYRSEGVIRGWEKDQTQLIEAVKG